MEYELVLTHHGIKGQRWGVRRFQNKNGSLTRAGRQRYGSDKDSAKKEEKPKKKSVSEMSDDELRRAIDRARAEDTYRQLRPEKVPAAKKFVNTLTSKVIVPAALNAGENFLKNYLNKVGNDILNDKKVPSERERLQKEYDVLKLKSDINLLRNPPINWDSKTKEQTYIKNRDLNRAEKYRRKLAYEKAKKEYEDWKASNSDGKSKPPFMDKAEEYVNNQTKSSSANGVKDEPISTAANSSTSSSGYNFMTNVTAQNRATRPVPANPWDLGTGKTFRIKKD
jgi:hypothetical protein